MRRNMSHEIKSWTTTGQLYIALSSISNLMNTHESEQHHPRSQLFTLRLWLEPFGDGQVEVRMQVQHVLSGERCYFRDWWRLEKYLQEKLEKCNRENQESDAK